MNELTTLVTASIALMTALGAAVKFVWNKVEARFTKIEADLDSCHTRHEMGMERRAVQLTVIELLWSEIRRIAPGADVLERAGKLLDQLKTGDKAQ